MSLSYYILILVGYVLQQMRSCDSCYNRVLCLQEKANQKEFLAGIKPLPRSARPSSVTAPSVEQQQTENRKELLGASHSSSSGLDSKSKRQDANKGNNLSSTANTLSEAHERLQERGEKLSRLSDRTDELSNQAGEFARMAKQLNEQQKNRWF